MHPLVTVVIPTYNRLALVQQAVASVVAQTYTNWELIVADDGSDDGSAETLATIKDSRIKILALSRSGNIAVTRNAGARAGQGPWLSFLDSDDLWVPERLEIQVTKIMQEQKRWGYGGFELMDKDLQLIPNKAGAYHPFSGWIAKEVLTTEASIAIGAILIERTLFEEIGGFNSDPELLYREDYELVLRLALKAEALAIPDLLLRIREHVGRSTNAFEYGHDRTAYVYEHFLRQHPEKDLAVIARRRLATTLAESAVQRISHGKYSGAVKRLGKALIYGDSLRHLLSVVRRGLK
jgi:glycosyltransferase involved in cell wall biosynthesis